MSSTNGIGMRRVTLAVSFDDRLEHLLETTLAIASATRAPVRLVHVIEPWTSNILAPSIGSAPEAMIKKLKAEAERIATMRLEVLAESMSVDVEVETAVLDGHVVEAISRDTKASRSDLVIVGCRARGSVTSQGCSTAVGLILDGGIPVMAVDESVTLHKSGRCLSVLAADDLSEGSKAAVTFAASLASTGSGARFVHLHVMRADDLRGLGERIDRAPLAGVSAERLDKAMQHAADQMTRRLSGVAAQLEANGCRCRQEVVCGVVNREISRAAIAARADVVVYGAHLLFHRDTRQSGQVPFKLMMAHDRPVIVVPQPESERVK